jgi:catechol 2,3-dioxygenase-like lactoylglutathione lyase family enzyme
MGAGTSLKIRALDHVVLTVGDIDRTLSFYQRALGMTAVRFGDGRHALAFGDQKLNLHQAGAEFEPKARVPTPGSVDLCLLTDTPIEEVMTELRQAGVAIELGPVAKTGARHALRSVYFRDPDGNLIEVANEVSP